MSSVPNLIPSLYICSPDSVTLRKQLESPKKVPQISVSVHCSVAQCFFFFERCGPYVDTQIRLECDGDRFGLGHGSAVPASAGLGGILSVRENEPISF